MARGNLFHESNRSPDGLTKDDRDAMKSWKHNQAGFYSGSSAQKTACSSEHERSRKMLGQLQNGKLVRHFEKVKNLSYWYNKADCRGSQGYCLKIHIKYFVQSNPAWSSIVFAILLCVSVDKKFPKFAGLNYRGLSPLLCYWRRKDIYRGRK